MGSGVRVILRKENYRGIVHWSCSEWITHVDKSLRIVSEELWERAQRRVGRAKDDLRLKSGGRPKYLLSGLLRCDCAVRTTRSWITTRTAATRTVTGSRARTRYG